MRDWRIVGGVRQLLVHRHKQVQARTRVKNQLQALALSQGLRKKWKLWTQSGRAELRDLRSAARFRETSLVDVRRTKIHESEMAHLLASLPTCVHQGS